MRKRKFLFYRIMVLIVLGMLCTGCKTVNTLSEHLKRNRMKPYVSQEEKVYNQAVNQFFEALDSRDKDAIRILFSSYIQKTDESLDEQIELLLEAYSGPTDICKADGSSLHGEYSNQYGKQTSLVDSVFPIVSNGTYYWCWFQLMYRNDSDKEQIGVTGIALLSADYYCAIKYGDEDAVFPDNESISVLMEYPMDSEVRAIDGNPYKYIEIERTLTKEKIISFFETSNKYSKFIEQFGEPNAANIYYMYELLSEENKLYYLRLGVNERTDSIYNASIVDEFGYVETLWKEEKDNEEKNNGEKIMVVYRKNKVEV